jgi:hypothetical protein
VGRPRQLARAACEAQIRSPATNHRLDVVLGDPAPACNYLSRRATAVVEIKRSLPLNGRLNDALWAPLDADLRKVKKIVNADAATWGIALMCVALPGNGNGDPLPERNPLNPRCVAIPALNTAPLQEILRKIHLPQPQ